MACIGDVLFIKNPLWNEEAELGEADYESDLGREVGVFDKWTRRTICGETSLFTKNSCWSKHRLTADFNADLLLM